MPIPLPLAGYNTSGLVNDVSIALTEWEVQPEVDDLDATNTAVGGVHVAFPGPLKCEVTLTGFYDGNNNPFSIGDAAGMQAGAFVALQIYVNDNLDVGSQSFWSFPVNDSDNQFGCMVKSIQTKASVKEKIMFTAHLIGSGWFVYPEGEIG